MRTAGPTVALATAAAATLVAGCGSGAATPATGSSPSPSSTPRSTRDPVRGEVVAIKGQVVTVTAADGTDSNFDITPTTAVNQQQDASIADATVGGCAFGIGERIADDLVAATQVVISDHGPKGPGDCRRGSSGDIHHLGVAGGEVTAIDGTTYTVNANAGPQRFQVGAQTRAVRLVKVPTSTLTAGQCVTARGPRDGSGRVTAASIVISPRSVNGCFPAGAAGGAGGG